MTEEERALTAVAMFLGVVIAVVTVELLDWSWWAPVAGFGGVTAFRLIQWWREVG